jgi:signal recognition particle receptor subunit beta
MKTLRLVVAGTPGAGKSTFVRTISDTEVVDTDRAATDETSLLKPKTTVAFDYGRFVFGSALEVQIYGTPGQSRFNFMWDFLIQRAQAYILLVPAHRPNDFHYARQILLFMNQRVQIPMLVGITHTDCPGACHADEIMTRLGYMNDKNRPPVLKVNPNDRASVVEAVMAAMALLVAQYGNNSSAPTKRAETKTSSFERPSSKSFNPFPIPNFSRGR